MKAPLAINGQVMAGQLELVWEFASSRYDAGTIQLVRPLSPGTVGTAGAGRCATGSQADPALVTALNSSQKMATDTGVVVSAPVTGRVSGYQTIAAAWKGSGRYAAYSRAVFLKTVGLTRRWKKWQSAITAP